MCEEHQGWVTVDARPLIPFDRLVQSAIVIVAGFEDHGLAAVVEGLVIDSDLQMEPGAGLEAEAAVVCVKEG